MDHQRNTRRLEGRARQRGAGGGGRSGQRRALHMGKVHTRLLEHRALFEHAALARAQPALPAFAGKGRAVFLFGFQRGADVVLQGTQYV